MVGNNRVHSTAAQNAGNLIEKGFLDLGRRQNRRVIRMNPKLRRMAKELLGVADVLAEAGLDRESRRARSESREQWHRSKLTYRDIPIPERVAWKTEMNDFWPDDDDYDDRIARELEDHLYMLEAES